ncbi:MAG: ribosome recycling factor [Bacteroidaceae bacterium]|jgi:ribosome recycling factor|nr:ribosome recycling factor [Bacteroidaceae bacterium]
MIDVKACLRDAEEMMQMTIMHLEEEYSHIRAGKANVHLLDCVRVSSYGAEMPLSNVATITTPDMRTIAIKPWDKNMIAPIEKAIIDSPVGIMPANNGEVIIIAIPPLTGERRKDLVKQCSHELETAKISIRNARRDGIDTMKKSVKDGTPEDVAKDGEESLQKIHDKYIKKAEEIFAAKEKEIMTV